MTDAIVVGLIAGICSVIAALASSFATTNKVQHELDKQNAVQNVMIDELTREVRIHNGFAERIPQFEVRLKHLEDDVSFLKRGSN